MQDFILLMFELGYGCANGFNLRQDVILICEPVLHQKYKNKANACKAGGNYIHPHRMFEIGPGGIPPNLYGPCYKVYENRKHTGCQNQKFFYFQRNQHKIRQHKECKTIDDSAEFKCTSDTQQRTQRPDTVSCVRLMLVDLCERVKSAYQEGCRNHT